MELYPRTYKNVNSLQSKLFGHRIKAAQTKYEYLIEFLQVAIARKEDALTGKPFSGMFPVDRRVEAYNLTFFP